MRETNRSLRGATRCSMMLPATGRSQLSSAISERLDFNLLDESFYVLPPTELGAWC